jgi:hypothetical protein
MFMKKHSLIPLIVVLISIGTQGCIGVALTAGGLASAVAVDHTLSGIAYKTFTVPVNDVRSATLTGLKQMEIGVDDTQKTESGYQILATASNRTIEVDLEKLTPKTTRMRVVAKKDGGVLRDSATATEIIIQTAHVLDR